MLGQTSDVGNAVVPRHGLLRVEKGVITTHRCQVPGPARLPRRGRERRQDISENRVAAYYLGIGGRGPLGGGPGHGGYCDDPLYEGMI